MDPLLFRSFLRSGTNDSKEAFFDEAGAGGDAIRFVTFVLGLRADSRTHSSFGEFREQWVRLKSGHKTKKWYTVFVE